MPMYLVSLLLFIVFSFHGCSEESGWKGLFTLLPHLLHNNLIKEGVVAKQ